MSLSRRARGAEAEEAACDYLVARGFRVLERNVRLGALELDVVAVEGSVLAFVEVRSRARGGRVSPFESVTREKRARLVRAAEAYLRAHPEHLEERRVRFDVVAVHRAADGALDVELARGAFTAT